LAEKSHRETLTVFDLPEITHSIHSMTLSVIRPGPMATGILSLNPDTVTDEGFIAAFITEK
jgi:hypothetical protein